MKGNQIIRWRAIHFCPCSTIRWVLGALVFLVAVLRMEAQQTVLYQDPEADFERLVKEYDEGLYGRCIRSAQKYIAFYRDHESGHHIPEAELYALRSGLRLEQPGVIDQVMAFSQRYRPAPVSQQAILLLGEDAYDRKSYDQAIEFFSQVDSRVLTREEQSALYFKLGYCLFVRKEFDQAASLFRETKEVRDKYFYPSNYYYGMTQYFKGNFEEAIRSFERVAPSEYYKDYVPYYITQIYFSQQDYKNTIGYGQQALQNPSVLNKTDIRHLIGQAMYETGDYENAIVHLAYVEKNSSKLRLDDFYQLGMAYYHTGRFSEAIPVLSQIRNEPGEKAHYANYYLGRCYLETGDKTSARNSLMNASKRDEVPAIATEATFHYGRLSAEAGDDVEAIRVLQTIPASATAYHDAQITMANILTQTQDYALAIREIEAMTTLSQVMKGAYQKVCLLRAEQLLQEGKPDEASVLLDRSLRYPVDRVIEARAYFWKGEMSHQQADYNESIKWFNQYFTAAGSGSGLPPQQSLPVAQYTQGYNYLRNGNYTEAQILFDRSIAGIRDMDAIPGQANLIQNQVYPDALLRAGDCAFKRSQYDKANGFYDESILKKLPGNDYAEYQKAIIKGLQKQPMEKIRLLEELVRDMPASLWADDALYQAGNAYQDEGETNKAIQSYERLVQQYKEKSPLLLPSLLRLGLLNYNTNRFEAALGHYKSVFQYNPDPETSREAMAAIQEIYVNELDTPDAYFAYAASVPGFEVTGTAKDSILYLAAENHYAQGDYDKAVVSFQKYIDQNPDGLYALKSRYLKAESLSLLKKYGEALTAYESVLQKGQSAYYVTSLYKAALIAFNHQQDMARAYAHYAAYIPLAESEEQAYEAMLGALRSAYRLKKAEEVYRLSEQILAHPRVTEDIMALSHYYSAVLAMEQKNHDRALRSFNDVIRLHSGELAAESRYKIALIYEQRGETDIAARLAEEAAKANVGYPFWVAKSLILLSDILFGQGDLLNASAILEAILENFQGDETIVKEATEKLNRVKVAETGQNRVKPASGDTLELQQHPKKD